MTVTSGHVMPFLQPNRRPFQPRRLFAPPPASRLFAHWSADRRVHLHFTGCALPLLLYLWADLCFLGASFEAGIVRHPADTYFIQCTLHYAGRPNSAVSGSL